MTKLSFKGIRFLLSLVLFASSFSVHAVIETYEFDSPKIEADYNQLVHELRCLVCQNQNLSGSNSDLAKDLRRQTYEMLTTGKSSDQVIEFMVARYGDFVLYNPQFKSSTYLLWLGPFLLLLLVFFLVVKQLKQKPVVIKISKKDLTKAKALLQQDDS